MEKIFIYKNGKIKVTYNECFMTKDYEEEYVTKKIVRTTKNVSKCFSLGVELMVHKGGRMCYGMLIAQVRPHDEQNSVKTSIAFTTKNSVRYEHSILLDDGFVYKGLPKEYVEQIIESIEQLICEKEIYPQYDVGFDYAANCEVGSSPMMFSYIAEIIMDMLYVDSIEEIFNMSIENFTEQYVKKIKFMY